MAGIASASGDCFCFLVRKLCCLRRGKLFAAGTGPPLSLENQISEFSYLQSERDLSISGMYIRSRLHLTHVQAGRLERGGDVAHRLIQSRHHTLVHPAPFRRDSLGIQLNKALRCLVRTVDALKR